MKASLTTSYKMFYATVLRFKLNKSDQTKREETFLIMQALNKWRIPSPILEIFENQIFYQQRNSKQ